VRGFEAVLRVPSGALTAEQVDRVRAALRSAAGDYPGALELAVEELEQRILPGAIN
jgi:hypothetical protein